MIADVSFAVRVYVKKNSCYRLGSLIIVSLYTVIWLGWLIWLHIVILNHEGKVCSGHYLADSITDNVTQLPTYALSQGSVLKGILIGVWCANGVIVLLAVIAGIVASTYLKKKAA